MNALADTLQTVTVAQSNADQVITVEGSIEAVKGSLLSPQVSGSITVLNVKAGDQVKAGQVLARIDTRIANQQVAASQAQVGAARAQLSAARQEYERKKRLHEKQYISQAALERAESDYKTAEAQTKAELAQTGVANVQSGLHTVTAPYAGIVSEVMTEQGDMAMPGKPLLALYDPKELRAVVNVPQSQIASISAGGNIKVIIPAAAEAERSVTVSQITVLPTADAVSNSVKVRLLLPQNLSSVSPGMFARAQLPTTAGKLNNQIFIPSQAVIKRSELVAVYVVNAQGEPQLRQVRVGRKQGDNIEIFAGLYAGEKLALDPVAAANYKTKKLLKK
ncbi:MAG TPA: efflux RND transporter periplasmic adaptor subunit [Methylotenera sp.]|nr:efflux RND transporter periplasmic adaptor subunit [Methylotenera sp.]